MKPAYRSGIVLAAALALLAGAAAAVAQERAVVPRKAVTLEGQLVKVKGADNLFILRPKVGKEVRMVVTPESVIRVNEKVVPLAEVPEGTPVTVGYYEVNGQFLVTTVEAPTIVAPVVVNAAAVGHVHGRVMEGERPQPGLPVILSSEAGRVVANQQTRLDGTFAFDNVAPGVYKVYSDKSSSRTVGEALVTVESGKVKDVVIELLRPPLP